MSKGALGHTFSKDKEQRSGYPDTSVTSIGPEARQ
jgi:hypothetical protein